MKKIYEEPIVETTMIIDIVSDDEIIGGSNQNPDEY